MRMYNNWLNCYFNFEDITQRIKKMLQELLTNNLLTSKEAIKIIKIDNAEILKNFSPTDLRCMI
jgi:hypothetical protein